MIAPCSLRSNRAYRARSDLENSYRKARTLAAPTARGAEHGQAYPYGKPNTRLVGVVVRDKMRRAQLGIQLRSYVSPVPSEVKLSTGGCLG